MLSHSINVDLRAVVLIPRMPVELLELVLMRTFINLFTEHLKSHYKTHEAIAAAYSALSAVCYNWWQTMHGWPHSNTRHWLRHRLQHSVQCKSKNNFTHFIQFSVCEELFSTRSVLYVHAYIHAYIYVACNCVFACVRCKSDV